MVPELGKCPELVMLVLQLCENPDQPLTERDLLELGEAGARLRGWGALQPAENLHVITCPSCDLDHEAELEFDSAVGGYQYYCGAVGYVNVDAEAVRCFRLDFRWFRARLAHGLQVGRRRDRELVPDGLWDLGAASLGERSWSAFLARDVGVNLNAILHALRTRGGKLSGLVLTTSADVPWDLDLPYGHRWLPLADVLDAGSGELAVVPEVLATALRDRGAGGRRARGRPSGQSVVLDAFERRRAADVTMPSLSKEAEAILGQLAMERPDLQVPAVGTVENIIRNGHRAWRSANPRPTK